VRLSLRVRLRLRLRVRLRARLRVRVTVGRGRELAEHNVAEHLDVVVVLQAVDQVQQELRQLEPVGL
jgi:hypothetical protein